MKNDSLREQLRKLLSWEDAHVSFETAVAGLPAELRGKRPRGLPHSPWQLVEHLRIAQRDILDFCGNAEYHELSWPEDYWPEAVAPRAKGDWEESIRQFQEDRKGLQLLVTDARIDLEASIPRGSGQTYLREVLLAADHAAYHIGELVVVRRALGAWKRP